MKITESVQGGKRHAGGRGSHTDGGGGMDERFGAEQGLVIA